MKIAYTGECCADCIAVLANGVTGDNVETVAHTEKMARHLGADLDHAHASCGDDCEGPFSWSSCDACGDTRGGERHRFTVLEVQS